MSAFDFEMFNLGDMWKKIKKNPARLLYGGVDPWSTKLWNKALGKHDEPLVDQMGGPYGGHTFSAFGNKDGGVYKRAEERGIGTGTAGGIHDAAHVIAAMIAAQYGMGQIPGGQGGADGQQGWQQYTNQMPQQQGQPQGETPYEKMKREREERELKQLLANLQSGQQPDGLLGLGQQNY